MRRQWLHRFECGFLPQGASIPNGAGQEVAHIIQTGHVASCSGEDTLGFLNAVAYCGGPLETGGNELRLPTNIRFFRSGRVNTAWRIGFRFGSEWFFIHHPSADTWGLHATTSLPIFGADPMRSLWQLCLAANFFFNFLRQFPWGFRRRYTHFVVNKGLGRD